MGQSCGALGIAREVRDFTAGRTERSVPWLQKDRAVYKQYVGRHVSAFRRSLSPLHDIRGVYATAFFASLGMPNQGVLASQCLQHRYCGKVHVRWRDSYRGHPRTSANSVSHSVNLSIFVICVGRRQEEGGAVSTALSASCVSQKTNQRRHVGAPLHATTEDNACETATRSKNKILGIPICVDHLPLLDSQLLVYGTKSHMHTYQVLHRQHQCSSG